MPTPESERASRAYREQKKKLIQSSLRQLQRAAVTLPITVTHEGDKFQVVSTRGAIMLRARFEVAMTYIDGFRHGWFLSREGSDMLFHARTCARWSVDKIGGLHADVYRHDVQCSCGLMP